MKATKSCVIVGRDNLSTCVTLVKNAGGKTMYNYERVIGTDSQTLSYVIMNIINILLLGLFVFIVVLIIRALLKYIRSKDVRKEKEATKISLGEVIKKHRTICKMTQEFVAESLGVSRQAVSKWENGTSDPSTSNLLALAKLFDIPAGDLLKEIKDSSN